MKKHILVISQYFYPELFRINDLTDEWVKRGYKVTVVTGIPNYPQGKFYEGYGLFKNRREIHNGVNIIRLPLIQRGQSSFMLVMNYLSFVFSGFIWKCFTKIKADYVFIFEVSPMTQALVGIWYARKRKIPCYLYVQDLWPDNVEIISGIKSKTIINTIGRLVDYIYSKCNTIFTTSQSFVNSINKRGVDIEKIKYWPQYAEDYYKPVTNVSVPEINQDNCFNIIFAGNIGNAQGLDVLVKSANIIKKDSNLRVRFNIVGDGRYKEDLIKLVNEYNLDYMFNFIDKKPPNKIADYIAVCDVAFLSLANSQIFEMTIPAKLQSYMACGIPVIASAAGETERIILESNCGLCSKPGDYVALADNIFKVTNMSKNDLLLLSNNAIEYNRVNFDKIKLLDFMDEYFV